MSISFQGWSREGKLLCPDGHDDVGVSFEQCMDGKPFCATVGEAQGYFASLDEAMSWAINTAAALSVLTGPGPLPDETSTTQSMAFLEERGLR